MSCDIRPDVGFHCASPFRQNPEVAVRDDDLIDATQEGAPVFGDTREDDDEDGAFASGPAPLRAPPTPQAAATVVARLDDIAGAGGISFLASQLDASDEGDDAGAFEAGATSPDLGAPRAATPAPAPSPPAAPTFAPAMRARPPMAPTSLPPTQTPSGQPPPAAWSDDDAPAQTTRPPSSLPPPPPSSRTFGAPPPGPLDPPVPPVTTPPSLSRRPAASLDPPLPPATSSGPALRRPPTAGLDPPLPPATSSGPALRRPSAAGLDPPLPPKRRQASRSRHEAERAASTEAVVVVGPPDAGGGRLRIGVVVLVVAVAMLVATVVMRERGGLIGGTTDPVVARALSDRARATLAPRVRAELAAAVTQVARSVGGEAGVVIKDRAGDAWLLPDGGVVVTDGLLRRLASDAQLAAVIAHLVAHRQLGHVGSLAAELDGPAVLAVAAAPLGVDEPAADRRAVELLTRGGWRPYALVDAEDALAASPWASRHTRPQKTLLEAVGGRSTGREDKDWYERQVRAIVGPP
jgi:hypothetical protein